MRKQKGITLIALVITIIVLLILAGVTISMVLGDNGVLTKATQSKEKTSIATEQEQVSVAATGARMDNEDASDLWITEENFEKELNAVIGERDVDYTLEEYWYYYKVTYIESGRSYYVDYYSGDTKTEEEALIEFTIGDETYYAIEGMTWDEWINSEYNTRGDLYNDCVIRNLFGSRLLIYSSNGFQEAIFGFQIVSGCQCFFEPI